MNVEPFAIQLDYINEICAAVLAQEDSDARREQAVRFLDRPVLSVVEANRQDEDAGPSTEESY